jgi:hypothetical protein
MAKTNRKEVGDASLEVKAGLEALARATRLASPQKSKAIQEQDMVRDLQDIFYGGRYRSWRPWMAEVKWQKAGVKKD